MNIQKQFSLIVALFMMLSLSLLLISSIKLLKNQTTQVLTGSRLAVNDIGATATPHTSNNTSTNTSTNIAFFPIMRVDLTNTPTPTATPTNTPTPTPTSTPTPTNTPTPSCLTVEEEPNNRLSEADLHRPLCENMDILGRLDHDEKVDDIYIIQSSSSNLIIRLTNIPFGTDYDLELYRETTRLARSRHSNNQNEEISIEVEAGKYYVRVLRYEGFSAQPYVIRWQNE